MNDRAMPDDARPFDPATLDITADDLRWLYPNGDTGGGPYRLVIPPPLEEPGRLVYDGAPPVDRLPWLEDR